ncbi:MAG: type II toxin-antitoxin system RelE/ParE family toxin [Bacteroidetes bacterium]|nr:type II toxin-antitoxin system RelE/ParE family toxin [Bacteroidota bacterium]MBU2584411.1 type II toxin-antitoxin system RelE/ParE family toxin [Bacteroidota bacterium]
MSQNKYTVRLLEAAEDDLNEILTYIAADRPSAAESLADKIEKNLSLLADNPFLGRTPRDEDLIKMGYRYLIVENYLLFYIIERQAAMEDV